MFDSSLEFRAGQTMAKVKLSSVNQTDRCREPLTNPNNDKFHFVLSSQTDLGWRGHVSMKTCGFHGAGGAARSKRFVFGLISTREFNRVGTSGLVLVGRTVCGVGSVASHSISCSIDPATTRMLVNQGYMTEDMVHTVFFMTEEMT